MNTKITLAMLSIVTVAILVSSTFVANPALAKNGNSVSNSDLRDTGKFLNCIANHGGNDISKKQALKCVDRFLS